MALFWDAKRISKPAETHQQKRMSKPAEMFAFNLVDILEQFPNSFFLVESLFWSSGDARFLIK